MERYQYGAVSDCGDIRTENQDSVLCLEGYVSEYPAALFAVADGMGGLSYGAFVSQYVTAWLKKWWEEDFFPMMEFGRNTPEDMQDLLDQALWDMNQSILKFRGEKKVKCGSTLSLLLLYGNEYYIRNVGDSRIYLLRKGRLRQITEDQSVVARMVREKRMTKEEARKSPRKNVLTMCVGMFENMETFGTEGFLKRNDGFLICSDGLYNPLEHWALEDILRKNGANPQMAAELLRKKIQTGAARDNVSAVVVYT